MQRNRPRENFGLRLRLILLEQILREKRLMESCQPSLPGFGLKGCVVVCDMSLQESLTRLPISGNIDQNLRNPSYLILSHCHILTTKCANIQYGKADERSIHLGQICIQPRGLLLQNRFHGRAIVTPSRSKKVQAMLTPINLSRLSQLLLYSAGVC